MGNCDSIRAALDGLSRERDNLQQTLNAIVGGDPGSLLQKQILSKQIQNLGHIIAATNIALQACLKTPPPPAFVKPEWNEEGPGPTAINDIGYSKAAGAIQALACDPIDPDRVFVGTVGGGIWLSNDAASGLSPSWVPKTDFQPSLCMSAIAISPLDPTRNTLYAGFGITSHVYYTYLPASPVMGILKTTDGGATWKEYGRSVFQDNRITRILPTGLSTSKGEIVLAATLVGLFRSDDGGVSWSAVPFFANTPLCDITSELGHPSRIYAASTTNVFRSDDGGNAQWSDITPPQFVGQNISWIRLSVCAMPDAAGNNWVYAGAQTGLDAFGIVFSSKQGPPWQSVGQPPSGQIPKVGALLVASPLLPTVFFCAAEDANHWMVDASTMQWTLVDHAGGNSTAAHTDGRDMQFSASADVLFEVNDGGIYRLINPHGRPKGQVRHWEEAVGNIRVTEFYSIAYDQVNHIIFGAAQDNSIPHQTTPSEIDWQFNEGPAKDGMVVGVDNVSIPSTSIHFRCMQGLQDFARTAFGSPATPSWTVPPALIVNSTGGLTIYQFEANRNRSMPWVPVWALNRALPTRILLGTDCLYESSDSGDHLDVLGGTIPTADGHILPTVPVGTVTAIAYGHRTNADAMYVGAGGKLFVRQSGSGHPTMANAYPGSTPRAIVIGPGDWKLAFVLDDQSRVWRTEDAGTSVWTEITGNLGDLTNDLRTIEYYSPSFPFSAEVIFVGGLGGVFFTRNPGSGKFAFWQKYGQNFPNALVTDLDYDESDDILVAGTLGRSAWSVRDVERTMKNAPSLRVLVKGPGSCFGGWVENTSYMFSANIQGLSYLKQPLSFRWSVPAAVPTSPLNGVQLTVTTPAAGSEVIVTLTVTDADNYKLFGYVVENTITAAEEQLRQKLCQLVRQVLTIAQINWPIDPLGPPIQLGNPAAARRTLEEFHRLTVDMAAVLGQLLHEGK